MKYTLDESLVNETIKISPRRVFKCSRNHISLRQDVRKSKGKYFCKCGAETEDATNTTTGHDFLEIASL